jgi:hypothetical protein
VSHRIPENPFLKSKINNLKVFENYIKLPEAHIHLNVTPSAEEQDPPLLHGLIEHGFTRKKE